MSAARRTVAVVEFVLVAVALMPCRAPAAVTGTTGSGVPFSIRQPSLAMNYLISIDGIFPAPGGVSFGRFFGEVTPFAGNFAPAGWAVADGRLLSVDEHDVLFTLLGTTYGGDGVTTFALPDLRGRSVIGVGQGAGLTNRIVAEAPGVPTVTLQQANLPSHAHTVPGGEVTGSAGGDQPFTTVQPSLAMNYIISTSGLFPSPGGGSTTMPFLGQVNLFAGSPNWFSRTPNANGQLLPINQNQALFSILGTIYGGDGLTNFALPDLRGRTAIGAGQGPGLAARAPGENVGHEATTLSTLNLPTHDHALPGSGVTAVSGGSQPADIMQPSAALSYIIATQGVYPSPGGGGSLTGPMIGQVALFAGTYAPSGWEFASGQLKTIAGDSALFSILGTTYGGDGVTTFALPDLRGRTIIGSGQGPGLESFALGEVVGAENVSLLTMNIAPHDHTVAVPEPAAWVMGVAGIAWGGWGMRRRRTQRRGR